MAAVSVRSYMSSGVACSLLRTATIHSAIAAASICPAHIHDPGPPNRTLPAAARSNKHRRRFTLIDAPEKPSASSSAATTAVRPSSNLLPAATAAAHRASRRSNVWPFRLMAGILLRTTPLQRRTALVPSSVSHTDFSRGARLYVWNTWNPVGDDDMTEIPVVHLPALDSNPDELRRACHTVGLFYLDLGSAQLERRALAARY